MDDAGGPTSNTRNRAAKSSEGNVRLGGSGVVFGGDGLSSGSSIFRNSTVDRCAVGVDVINRTGNLSVSACYTGIRSSPMCAWSMPGQGMVKVVCDNGPNNGKRMVVHNLLGMPVSRLMMTSLRTRSASVSRSIAIMMSSVVNAGDNNTMSPRVDSSCL